MVPVISEKRRSENGECSLTICSPKYKRRKVYVVRDFPPGCGPNAMQINGKKSDVDIGGQKVDQTAKDVVFDEEKKDIPIDSEGKGCLEPNDVSNEIIIDDDPRPSQDLSKEPLGNPVESPIALRDTVVGNDIQSEDVAEETSLPHYPIPSGLVWKERKYPPRRKVCASRDFPPRCGCNVKQLNEVDDDDKDLGQEKIDVDPCKEIARLEHNTEGEGVVSEEILDRVEGQLVCYEEAYTHEYEEGIGGSKGIENKDLIVYTKDKFKRKPFSVFSDCDEENAILVQSLTASRRGKHGMIKSSLSTTNTTRSKRKNNDQPRQNITNEDSRKRSKMIVPRLEDKDGEDSSEDDGSAQDFQFLPRKRTNVVRSSLEVGFSNETGASNKVRETLKLFRAVVRKLLQGEETKTKDVTKSKDQENTSKRIDLRAAKLLKDHGKSINNGKKSMLGPIPGVEVGDFFHYRIELSIIGLHRPPQGGIDYLKQGNTIIATSIVASGGYANDVDSSDVLVYTGQGGNACGDKQAEDQKLERGNLALKNSIDVKNPVRVIRGFKESKSSSDSSDGRKLVATYTYDGLYIVEKYWQDLGPHGKLVYKFQLRRLPGQKELAWKEVKRSQKHKAREGRCVDDISKGKEIFPICAINTIDDEKPPEFNYITKMRYPEWCRPIPPTGCGCNNGCLDSEHCACVAKNGGEIPYNHNGAIVQAKPLVYECGPHCKCPTTCHNRVSQCGIKFPLEVFKTESRGWGVRALSSIPSGSFICEYLGEVLDDKEAEQRLGSDEYLFDIGRNYNDFTLLDGLSTLLPDMTLSCYDNDVVENIGFTIDALKYGNIGRFINHSCNPNLYAQNVLYDHTDKRIPHVMLFASENIPPLQELTYHYNYTVDQVFDSDGNVKKKNCYCGASDCTGRMY